MIPGFQRKLRKFIRDMSVLDPEIKYEVGTPTELYKHEAVPVDVTYTSGGKDHTYPFRFVNAPKVCLLQLPGAHKGITEGLIYLDSFYPAAIKETVEAVTTWHLFALIQKEIDDKKGSTRFEDVFVDHEDGHICFRGRKDYYCSLEVKLVPARKAYAVTMSNAAEKVGMLMPMNGLYTPPLFDYALKHSLVGAEKIDRDEKVLILLVEYLKKAGFQAEVNLEKRTAIVQLDATETGDIGFDPEDDSSFGEMRVMARVAQDEHCQAYKQAVKVTKVLMTLTPDTLIQAAKEEMRARLRATELETLVTPLSLV